jgi:o-succinylbenzoate synthase
MTIVAVDHRVVRWPIDARGSARGADRERVSVVVSVRDDEGMTGLGEAAPLPGMSSDTIEDAIAAVRELAARLPSDQSSPRHASAVADRVTTAPAARFAIETALLAAYAQRIRTSIAALLAPMPQGELQCAVVVDDEDEAQVAVAFGAPCLKIKVGTNPSADIDRVHAIASRVPGCPLRLDANRGWPADEVDAIMAKLQGLAIEYVEEPCRDAHQLLACDLPYHIALDESLVSLDAAELERALGSPQLAAIVLKPTLLGGFARCLELAAAAHRHGVAPIVSHTLEGPLGTAACRELARALGGDVVVGLGRHPGLFRFTEARWERT